MVKWVILCAVVTANASLCEWHLSALPYSLVWIQFFMAQIQIMGKLGMQTMSMDAIVMMVTLGTTAPCVIAIVGTTLELLDKHLKHKCFDAFMRLLRPLMAINTKLWTLRQTRRQLHCTQLVHLRME